MIITKEIWNIVSSDEGLKRVLPDSLKAYLESGFEKVILLAPPESAKDYGDVTQPSLRYSKVDPSYIEFLNEQIRMKPKGEEWNLILIERREALNEFVNCFVYKVGFHSMAENYCSVWISSQNQIIHLEAFWDDKAATRTLGIM